MNDLSWEPVIGLEIHVALNTRSKLFSAAPNRFGDDPNTNISVVCTGQPGALPILNQEAVRKAVQFGLAVNAKINLISHFDRKSYFYPDSPRNFQITQYDEPIVIGGMVMVDVDGESKLFGIHHTHLEDDAGMLKHFNTYAGIDYNRAGAPLVEIVSLPCLHSAKDAVAFASAVRLIMLYLDASDCNMEEGSLRFDVNVSVRRKGEKTLRPKIEIKNLNSFRFLETALDEEIQRQIALYTDHPDSPWDDLVPPGTYRWDPERGKLFLMRRKESADDYRYFPEPDLVPIVLTQEYVDSIQNTLPELPHDRYRRYISTLGLTEHAAAVLINDKPLGDFFEEALKLCSNPRLLCNWIMVEFTGRLKDGGESILTLGIPPAHIARLVQMIDEKKITGRIAKSVADDMVKKPALDPESIVSKNPDYQPLSAVDAIEPLIDQVIEENAQTITDYRAGHEKAFAFLVGQVMKKTRGKASPQVVNDLLKKKLSQ